MKASKMLLFVLTLGFLGHANAQRSLPLQYVFAGNIPSDVLTPTKISSLVGKDSQDKPTLGIIETLGGDSVISSGYIKVLKPDTNRKYFTCAINEFKFALLKNDFIMKGEILFDLLGNKQEALLLEFDTCLCTNRTKIKYSSDSLITNVWLPIKLLVKDVEVRPGMFYPSSVSGYVIENVVKADSVKRNVPHGYLLLPVLEDGTSCTMFWLNRQIRDGLVKEIVYELSYQDARLMSHDGTNFIMEGKRVDRFDVVEEVDVRVLGVEKLKHRKRARK